MRKSQLGSRLLSAGFFSSFSFYFILEFFFFSSFMASALLATKKSLRSGSLLGSSLSLSLTSLSWLSGLVSLFLRACRRGGGQRYQYTQDANEKKNKTKVLRPRTDGVTLLNAVSLSSLKFFAKKKEKEKTKNSRANWFNYSLKMSAVSR